MSTSTKPSTQTIDISLRELRLVVGRILRDLDVPRHSVPAIRDTIVTAEALGLGALRYLNDASDALRANTRTSSGVGHDDHGLTIDAHGRSAYEVIPDIMDLLPAAFTHAECPRICIHNVTAAPVLALLGPLAADLDVDVSLDWPAPDRCRVNLRRATDRAHPPRRASTAMEDLLQHGTRVPTELWWSLYHTSNRALTPDSPISRQHTGRSVFNASGEILGEVGEDWSAASPPGLTTD